MIPIRKPLTKENILSLISSYDIFKFYSPNFQKLNKLFKSDLRKENNPSCSITSINGDLLYTDFGLGKSFRCIDFVMFKYNLTYAEALQKINMDFNLGLGGNITLDTSTSQSPIIHKKINIQDKPPTIIQKKKRPFTKKDLQYWNEFYWTEEMLKLSKTESISHYWINGNMITVGDELAFSYEYYWHNGRFQRKLYFPERNQYKWISNVDNTIVQLVDVMPKYGDILFITSSKKDAGIFWRMNMEGMFRNIVVHGVAPNNEVSFVPKEWFRKIKTRYKSIIIWYNNDFTGINNASKFSSEYEIPYCHNPIGSPKDPSDFCKEYGIKKFFNFVTDNLIKLELYEP